MSNTLVRLLKIAEAISDSGDIEAFNSFCAQFESFAKKYKIAHMEPKNDGTTPNPWRCNMDYSGWESSPYFGNVSEFMKKFPGGIKDWIAWRNETKKERFQKWDPKQAKDRMARLEILMKVAEEEEKDYDDYEELHGRKKESEREKKAHYEPVGPDNTKDFPEEPHLYSGDNVGGYESVKKYLEERRKATGQSVDDAALSAAKDFVNYYELLLKGKARRKAAKII